MKSRYSEDKWLTAKILLTTGGFGLLMPALLIIKSRDTGENFLLKEELANILTGENWKVSGWTMFHVIGFLLGFVLVAGGSRECLRILRNDPQVKRQALRMVVSVKNWVRIRKALVVFVLAGTFMCLTLIGGHGILEDIQESYLTPVSQANIVVESAVVGAILGLIHFVLGMKKKGRLGISPWIFIVYIGGSGILALLFLQAVKQ